MNITYKWGFYIDNKLVLIDAQINVDYEYYKRLKNLLRVDRLKDYELISIAGSSLSGHYLMADSFRKNSIAYTFGLNRDASWELEMVRKGYQSFIYDHNKTGLPFFVEGFNYFQEGLSGDSQPLKQLDTLANYIKRNGHQNRTGMILKMDIEGAEWDFLNSVDIKTLKQFDQIIFEMHNLVRSCSKEESNRRLKALEKLNWTHQLVHLHANNTSYVVQMNGFTFPDVIEVTYVNRDKFKTFEDPLLILPTDKDVAIDKNREDVYLGNWNRPFDDNLLGSAF